MTQQILIATESPAADDITALLSEHLNEMAEHSPPESVHALDLTQLKSPDISFYAARNSSGELLGCAALKTLSPVHCELKSMRTARPHLRKGVAAALLQHLISEAKMRGAQRLSLETGTPVAFEAARQLYLRSGFAVCAPFANYETDPYSVCMTRSLTPTPAH